MRVRSFVLLAILAGCSAAGCKTKTLSLSAPVAFKEPAVPANAKALTGVMGNGSAPSGYDRATVLGIFPTRAGSAVLLADAQGTRVVPIFVGGSEALTIQLRLKGEKYARPLTHDLLSDLVKALGGTPVRVQVDDLKGNTFTGSVFVRQGNRTIKLDARPSDAIAFALGSGVPIYASRAMIEAAGISKDEIEDDDDRGRKRGPISL